MFTYNGVSNPDLHPNPPPPQTVTRSVTISPPAVDHIEGTGVLANYATSIPGPGAGSITATSLGGQPGYWINFILKSAGKSIGPYFSCSVQERITNYRDWNGVLLRADTTWIPNDSTVDPATGQNSSYTYGLPYTGVYGSPYSNGTDYAIRDFKCCTQPPGAPTGAILTYTQENQIFWLDFNGNPVTPVFLGSQNWTINGTATQTSIGYVNTP